MHSSGGVNSCLLTELFLLLIGFDLVAFAIDCVMSGTVVLHFSYTI